MKIESRKQRLRNLTNLTKVLNVWHLVYAVIFLTFFPYLTIGTEIHGHVVLLSQYGTLGILLAPLYVKFVKWILGWYVKTGRNLESPTFVPLLLVGALIGTSTFYVILRIFKHDGNWKSTLAVSHEDAVISLLVNLLLALLVGLSTLTVLYYREGENIVLKSKRPSSFWAVLVVIFSIPLLFVLVIFLGHFAN